MSSAAKSGLSGKQKREEVASAVILAAQETQDGIRLTQAGFELILGVRHLAVVSVRVCCRIAKVLSKDMQLASLGLQAFCRCRHHCRSMLLLLLLLLLLLMMMIYVAMGIYVLMTVSGCRMPVMA